ncbi:MAG: acetyltransferase [Legionellaceae bacterium]|nr:acetyltransferase [Legionellaceae bacterium]
MKPLLLIGGGGHCRAAIDVIESTGCFTIQGIVQPKKDDITHVLGYQILGEDSDLPNLLAEIPCVLVTVGQIKQSGLRQHLFEMLQTLKAEAPVIISPNAYVSRHACLGEGTLVMHGAIVNSAARIGLNCIINTLALIEHDVQLGNHCHISTGARVNGGVVIEDHCFIGSGAVIHQSVRICSGSVIGAGCVIASDVTANTVVRY